MCLHERFNGHFNMHELQFGFVPNSGCKKAVFIVRVVCVYFWDMLVQYI